MRSTTPSRLSPSRRHSAPPMWHHATKRRRRPARWKPPCYSIAFVCVLTVALTRTSPRRETIAVRALKLADGVADADYADADVRKDSDDERGADTNHKRTRASFETCSSCSTCVPHSELGEDDVVDSRGWCERCDCDVKVERIDAGNPGRYVGKSEAMVLRELRAKGKR